MGGSLGVSDDGRKLGISMPEGAGDGGKVRSLASLPVGAKEKDGVSSYELGKSGLAGSAIDLQTPRYEYSTQYSGRY